jgi:nucleotide-binding universal stress UspA family protein
MFKNILVPVDGSANAHKAVELAGDLARHYGAQIALVHVLRRAGDVVAPEGLEGYMASEHVRLTEQDFLRLAATEIVDREAAALEAMGLAVERLVEIGDPATEIVGAAKRHGADLIVIGSRGRGGVVGLLLGSVSGKVAQLAPCTCITVR